MISFIFLVLSILLTMVSANSPPFMIEVNYDTGEYIILKVGETLEIICKNLVNRNPPSWTYPRRMHNNRRVKFKIDVGESRMVISKAEAEDAGKYTCEIEYEYEGNTYRHNKKIEVIVNELKSVTEENDEKSTKLICSVHAYPSATVVWKIDYDKEELRPTTEEPNDDYWMPSDPRVVVDKSVGRFTLKPYNGVQNAELIIANVSKNDNGNYSCYSSNFAGENSRSLILYRQEEDNGKSASKNVDNINTEKARNVETSQEGLGRTSIVWMWIVGSFFVATIVVVGVLCWLRYNRGRNEPWESDTPEKKTEDLQFVDISAIQS